MASPVGPPPGLSRPKFSEKNSPPPFPLSSLSLPLPPSLQVLSPAPRHAASAVWASSLECGLFPPSFNLPPQVPCGIQPLGVAVPPTECLHTSPIMNLAVYPAPSPMDPWHIAHVRVCAHASQPCAGCSASFICCSCRALRFTPGNPPVAPGSNCPSPSSCRSRSASPALFRDVGNAPTPPGFDDAGNDHPDDDAYARALAKCDTCDNSSCPRGADEPTSWTLTVEQFDEGMEEFFNRTFRACGVCNCSCKKSFMGHKVKSRVFDNSTKASHGAAKGTAGGAPCPAALSQIRRNNPIPGSAAYALEHPSGDTLLMTQTLPSALKEASLERPPAEADGEDTTLLLRNALQTLNARPPTPATFVATVRVKHDAMCAHPVTSCPDCSCGLICCSCKLLFTPAVARHLACKQCGHIAYSCCQSASCCKCGKPWLPSDAVVPQTTSLAQRFRGGAGTSNLSSPEPDIWTPSPRSSPDEIDDLTARAALPLPASQSGSDASRAPSCASSVDTPADVAATPLPTPDYSAITDEQVDGLVHPSFPDRAILDDHDKRHFLGRGDLSIASLKLYARRIFTDTSHWITVGHFLADVFQGCTLNGSRDDFRRFVILVGTQLGFGDVAISMSESLDVNRKMANEYMRLRDVATTWKQKAKANSKDAKNGRKAQDELEKARDDIASILEERQVLIKQRQEFLAKDDQLTTELNRVHRDYGSAIDDNTKFAARIAALEAKHTDLNGLLDEHKNLLSIAEHHRDSAERKCAEAVLNLDKSLANLARDKAFYEARITALSSPVVPSSQPDSEIPLSAAAIDKSVLITRVENLKKELSVRDAELTKLRAEVSLSPDVNTLRAELAEAKAVAARLSGMYEQKSKDYRESELERLSLLGKQILANGSTTKNTPPARPRPASRRGRQRSRSTGRDRPGTGPTAAAAATSVTEPTEYNPATSSSQPFWQDEPLFTKHVAAVATATMSALPHLPFEAAIATAFTTVRNVGPPPPLKLDNKPGNRRSSAPSPPTPAPAAPQGGFTFADMVKAAASKDDNADKKKKPTWRAIETSKALAIRPSTKGTRVSELHLKVPKTSESADLFKLKGTALLDRIAKLINNHTFFFFLIKRYIRIYGHT